MPKLSISLPNNALITFESDDAGDCREIIGLAIRNLAGDFSQSHAAPADNGGGAVDAEKRSSVEASSPASNGVSTSNPGPFEFPPPPAEHSNGPASVPIEAPSQPEAQPVPAAAPAAVAPAPADVQPAPANAAAPAPPAVVRPAPAEPPRPPEASSSERVMAEQAARAAAEHAFVRFCHSQNPLGDMRKVIAAAEGAAQFLEMETVSAEDLAGLYDMIGWPPPSKFSDTIRNAARTSYRWLERVPGRAGRYKVTDAGRSAALNH